MVVLMDGFKERDKGGTTEFSIRVPPIPWRCHLLLSDERSPLESVITEGKKQKRQSQNWTLPFVNPLVKTMECVTLLRSFQ